MVDERSGDKIGQDAGQDAGQDDGQETGQEAVEETAHSRRNPASIDGALERRLSSSMGTTRFGDLDEELSESKHWLLGSRWFNGTVNLAIVASALQMGVAHEVVEKEAHEVMDSLEHVFTAIFTAELILKLWILRSSFFTDSETRSWNALDFLIGVVSIVDVWVLNFFFAGAGGSALSVIRIFRLLRLLRILKMLRHVPELMMVVEGMLAAMRSMVWIIVLLSGLMYILSIICVEVIGNAGTDIYPDRNPLPLEIKRSVVEGWNSYIFFGSLSRALVSLFSMMLLSEWSAIIRPVWEMQPLMIFLFSGLIFVTTFGIFNVMIGVVVERTNEAMAREKRNGEAKRKQKRLAMVHVLAGLMFEMDEDGDGKVSLEEMLTMNRGNRASFQEIVNTIDLPHGFDLEALFTMFDDDGSGELTQDEFVLGMLRLIEGGPFQQACLHQFMLSQIKAGVSELEESRQQVFKELAALRAELREATGLPPIDPQASTNPNADDVDNAKDGGVADAGIACASKNAIMMAVGAPAWTSLLERQKICAEAPLYCSGASTAPSLPVLWRQLSHLVEMLEKPISESAARMPAHDEAHEHSEPAGEQVARREDVERIPHGESFGRAAPTGSVDGSGKPLCMAAAAPADGAPSWSAGEPMAEAALLQCGPLGSAVATRGAFLLRGPSALDTPHERRSLGL